MIHQNFDRFSMYEITYHQSSWSNAFQNPFRKIQFMSRKQIGSHILELMMVPINNRENLQMSWKKKETFSGHQFKMSGD